jgi:phosphatidylinositol alpha-mannosyltransferase
VTAAEPVTTEPLRVCMMVTYDLAAPGGGVKHHAQCLAAALRKRGDTVTVVGPSSKPIRDPYTKTFGGVINIPGNGSDNMLGIFASPLAIAKFFRENPFDVIHIHEPLQPSLAYWATWSTRDIPHVATFHAFMEEESTALRVARKFWGSTVFPFYQRAIAVSEPAARFARHHWRRPLAIIPNGVPTEVFAPADVLVNGHTNGHNGHANGHNGHANGHNGHLTSTINGAAKQQGPVKLLFVGRIGDERKGAKYLFEAYRGLIARGLDVTLDVVGEQGNAAPPPELPGLRYHGAVGLDRLVQLYRSCDVFVAPSTGQESFGIVLLEAMSSAKPVVCSDIDGYRQVAVPEGSYLVPPADSRALEEQLAKVIQLDASERRALGEANRLAAEVYDWNRLADRVRREYVEAIAAHRSQR